MKLDGIASFVAVAEEGSISGAARTLRLSKSVVSERLAELERSLGATLLHRTTRRVSVTEDGAAFLERAKRILREVSEAAADLSERRGTLGGPIRIAAPVTFGRMHLGPALYPFLAANPEIEMSLELDDRRVDIASDVYDGVVRHGAIDDSRLMVWRLAPSRRVLVACVGGELHDLGARMTADFYEMAGFDVRYLGSNLPTESLSAMVREDPADLVSLSVTMSFHVDELRHAVGHLRDAGGNRLHLAAGGHAFEWAPGLVAQLGIEVSGSDAVGSVDQAKHVLRVHSGT